MENVRSVDAQQSLEDISEIISKAKNRQPSRQITIDDCNEELVILERMLCGFGFGLWSYDIETRKFWGDSRFCQICSLPKEQNQIYIPVWEILKKIAPFHRESVFDTIKDAATHTNEIDMEFCMNDDNCNQSQWVRIKCLATANVNSQFFLLHGLIEDITKRRVAEQRRAELMHICAFF